MHPNIIETITTVTTTIIIVKILKYVNMAGILFPRSFEETFNSLCPEKPWVTRLSSAGLIYLHFGRQVLSQLTHLVQGNRELEILYDKVSFYKKQKTDV